MSITHETWLRCKTDFISGKGSMREVAARYAVGKSTLEKKALSEEWTRLRREFETRTLEKLLPPVMPAAVSLPVAMHGTINEQWLAQRMESYYRENAALVDQARRLLAKKLGEESGELSIEALAKLASALGGIVDAENKLLGLNQRQHLKSRRLQSRAEPRRHAEPLILSDELASEA